MLLASYTLEVFNSIGICFITLLCIAIYVRLERRIEEVDSRSTEVLEVAKKHGEITDAQQIKTQCALVQMDNKASEIQEVAKQAAIEVKETAKQVATDVVAEATKLMTDSKIIH